MDAVVVVGGDLAARVLAGLEVAGGIESVDRGAGVGRDLLGQVAETADAVAGDEVAGIGDRGELVEAVDAELRDRIRLAGRRFRLRHARQPVEGVVALLCDPAKCVRGRRQVAVSVVLKVRHRAVLSPDDSARSSERGADSDNDEGLRDAFLLHGPAPLLTTVPRRPAGRD